MNKIGGTARTVNEILKDMKYSIDYFQREYRWQNKQITELIDDLTGKFLENYEFGQERSKVESYSHYFMGSIVISQKNIEKYIIDGQQRLTSLTLFLIFLRNLQKNYIEKVPIDDLIYSEKYGKKSFNLDVEERAVCMKNLYEGKDIEINGEPESIRNMYSAYQCIEDAFPDQLRGDALPYFIDWLKYNVHLVEIIADSDEDAYDIFETMNDRGLSLSSTEMLKGYLLSNINEAKRFNANDRWRKRIREFNDAGKEVESEFFKNWFRSQYATKIREPKKDSQPEDFDQIGTGFHRWLRNESGRIGLKNEESYSNFIDIDFEFFSKQYLKLIKASQEPIKGLEFILYNAHQNFTLQYMMLLAPLKTSDSEEIVNQKFRIVSHFIDILLTWRVWNSRNIGYASMLYSVFTYTKEIRGLSIPLLAQKLYSFLDSERENFSTNERLVLNHQNRHNIHRFLARLTDYVETQSGQPSHYRLYMAEGKERCEIEHIWSNHYLQHKDEFVNEADFSDCRNFDGGLLLLPKTFNASYGDLTFEEKVKLYDSQNLLARSLNSQCYEHNPGFLHFLDESKLPFRPYSEFKKINIEERCKLYQQLAIRVWNPEDILTELNLPIPPKQIIEITTKNGSYDGDNIFPDFEGKKPESVEIDGEVIPIRYWNDIIVEVCNFLYENHKQDFEERISFIETYKYPCFSKNKDELKVAAQVKNSNLYVEVGRSSANGAVAFSEKLMALFGYNNYLKITTKEN